MVSADLDRIRFGALTPIVGPFALIGTLTPRIGISPARDPIGFAHAANDVGFVNLAGLIEQGFNCIGSKHCTCATRYVGLVPTLFRLRNSGGLN